jgi:spectinomycin phosphotransferase
MRTEPTDLDPADLRAALDAGWGLRAAALTYVPEGGGSHHWRCLADGTAERWVSADDLTATFHAAETEDVAFAALDRAFGTAVTLRAAGLEFVVAPLPDCDGRVLRRVGGRYAVRVAPVVEGAPGQFGVYSADDRRRVGAMVGRLHAESAHVPAGLPATADLTIPSRSILEQALVDAGRPWRSGPLAKQARALVAPKTGEIRARLSAHDTLAARVRAGAGGWVVTHGEPHGGNVITSADGGLHLIDWDTALVAPRERDLHMVLDDDLNGWDEYRAAAGGDVDLDMDALGLYRRMWALADIASFVAILRRPHADTVDMRHALEALEFYLGG